MTDHNSLIDDNGNPLSTLVTTTTSNNPNFLSSIWRKMWPSREARIKYQVHTVKEEIGNSTEMNNTSSITSGFWSKMSMLTSHRERCENESSSIDHEALEDKQNGNVTNSLDYIYDEVPRMKTSRKVYGESSSSSSSSSSNTMGTTTPHIKTRRESILSNNRRLSRNLHHDYSHLQNSDKTFNSNVDNVSVGFRKFNDCDMNLQHVKRVSFKEDVEEEEDDQWLVQQRTAGRENFYNVNEVDMASLYRSGKQSDLIIKCRGKDFHVHTFVLKAQSGHFRRLLFIKNDSNPIVINDMTWDDMEALLKYMYTGEIDINYTSYDGYLSSRFSFLLSDYEVPLPFESSDMTAIL